MDTRNISSQEKKSNKSYRVRHDHRDNFPDGYTEDWSDKSIHDKSTHDINRSTHRDNKSTHDINKSTHRDNKSSHRDNKSSHRSTHRDNKSLHDKNKSTHRSTHRDDKSTHDKNKSSHKSTHRDDVFKPVSIILSTSDNMLLNKDNNYCIRFSTGILEGSGISINEKGDEITFLDAGSYKLEICAEATPFSDVDVELIYHSDSFSSDVEPFSHSKIPKDEGKLQIRGIPTMLPVQENLTITVRLVPDPHESIIVISGARLLIHKVA